MTQRTWAWMRWVPTVLSSALGLLTATMWLGGGPQGCTYGVMADLDSVRQLGRSWFPPQVDCEFGYNGQTWIERQSVWGYYLPASFLLGAALCAWYAARHSNLRVSTEGRSLPRHVLGVVMYWLVAFLNALGLFALIWRESFAVVSLAAIPILSVWTLQWLWRASSWPMSERALRKSFQTRQGWGPGQSRLHPASRPVQ